MFEFWAFTIRDRWDTGCFGKWIVQFSGMFRSKYFDDLVATTFKEWSKNFVCLYFLNSMSILRVRNIYH